MELPLSVQAILEDRFFHPGETEWYDVCERVARTWGRTPAEVGAFYEMMRNRRGIPNTPAVANAGRKNAMASACFVLGINDSLTDGEQSIMGTLMDAARVHKSGGGTGFSGARIRGRGEMVASTGRPAPGAVNVLELYSDAIGRVTQAGMRPGANMFILPDTHPDVMEFIGCKQPKGDETKADAERKITNFNISVGVGDAMMSDVAEGKSDPVFDAIIDGMWENGEPGIWFRDTTNAARLHEQEFEATNPCGEVPLLPNEACVLGSVNIAAHIESQHPMFDEPFINYETLGQTIRTMVRLLDNIIDLQTYPTREIEVMQRRYRKIGVNPMGWADTLHRFCLKYGGEGSLRLARKVAAFFQETTYDESRKLADERGPYPAYARRDPSAIKHDQFPVEFHGDLMPGYMLHALYPELPDHLYPYRRNICTMVGAPTGTVSRLALCSASIEPHPNVNENGEYLSFILSDDPRSPFTDRVYVNHKEDYAFTPADEVTLHQHIAMQAAWQEHTDQAISKTVNCPETTTKEELAAAVVEAWRSGCKGVTVLRHHSRENVVIGDADCNGVACDVPVR